MHDVLVSAWTEADKWLVGRYVIMPDHIHLFCAPAEVDFMPVKKWVSYWKRLVSKKCRAETSLWQRDCWDTQLRMGESYHDKWEYVRNNPVRAGLCDHPDDWSFQGELKELRW